MLCFMNFARWLFTDLWIMLTYNSVNILHIPIFGVIQNVKWFDTFHAGGNVRRWVHERADRVILNWFIGCNEVSTNLAELGIQRYTISV